MSELLEPSVITPKPDAVLPDDIPVDVDAAEGLVESISPGRMALKRFLNHKAAVVFGVIFLIIVLAVIFAPWTARYPENFVVKKDDGGNMITAAPNAKAWFGTNSKAFDLYSQIIWGGRVSLFIGLMVALCASLVGTIVGSIAGFKGGKLDDILMRVTDLFLAFPTIVLLLVLRNLFDNVEALSWLFGDLKSVRFMVVLLVIALSELLEHAAAATSTRLSESVDRCANDGRAMSSLLGQSKNEVRSARGPRGTPGADAATPIGGPLPSEWASGNWRISCSHLDVDRVKAL